MSDETPPDGPTPQEERTVFQPLPPIVDPVAAPAPAMSPAPPPHPSAAPSPPDSFDGGSGLTRMAPRIDGARIQIGDVLNHIFEVKRFIARGGMGEVFEGANVNSDERVAIKVMLPALAADPTVQAMFRKEARTLTRLSHPALVQYRVLAQEPQLGVLYIVTEFVDGVNLSDALGEQQPDEAGLRGLLRRLAEGLRAAHALGAIHRDISPDNVLLDEGRLEQAKVIDFGIAKDLDPGAKTIIGDGFAGKLGYVAPEQLGDFDREVGPWTDVYSLALVILAVATGRNVDLGGTFVDAIDKRRNGPDLSAIPEGLRPTIAAMLRPNPAERLRSMDAVLDHLAGTGGAPAIPSAAPGKPAKAAKPPKPPKSPPPAGGTGGTRKGPIIAGGAAAGVAVLAAVGYLAFGRGSPPPRTAADTTTAAPATTSAVDPSDRARTAVETALPGIACSWLDLTRAPMGPGGVSLVLAGVAGRPMEAQSAVTRAVTATGAQVAAADFSEVAPISTGECSSIDAFRAIRLGGGTSTHLSVPQRRFEMSRLQDGEYQGQIGARSVINLDLGASVKDFALYGLDPSGTISPLVPNKAAFDAMPKPGFPIADLGGGRYRLQIDANHSGWSGILLLTGDGGFSDALVATGAGTRTEQWRERFASAAAAGHWRAEMVWFKMVDEVPN